MSSPRPVVICFSGHDPTGGAGIQADIETIFCFGCHPGTVVTALTAQDTVDVRRIFPQRKEDFLEQARCIIADLPIAAVKIGLLGSVDIALAVAELLAGELAGVPSVLDPILAAGGGKEMAGADLLAVIKRELLPLTLILTPNFPEARSLAGGLSSPDDCAEELLRLGCAHVLITGAHEKSENVVNRFYGPQGFSSRSWERLPHEYHGSGCTLAAAVAAALANGHTAEEACLIAQRFAWESLARGFAPGTGQWLPNRQMRT